MNAFQWIDIKFQQTSIKLSKMNSQSYDLHTGGEANALQMILSFLRFVHKWIAVPRLVLEFLAVKVGLKAEPVSPLFGKAADQPIDAGKQSNGTPQPGTS